MRRPKLPGSKAGAKQGLLLLVAMSLCVLSGCATTAEPTYRYTLSEPVPALVRYRVFEGDDLVLTLRDDSVVVLRVSSVDEVAIHGKDGTVVPIADIRQLRSPEEYGVGDAALGIAVYTVMVPVSILMLPVALPMLLFYDWEKVGDWYDDRLCRVVAHPEFYGYTGEGEIREGDKTPPFQEVQDEMAERELQCDALARVESYCASNSDSGPAYQECVARMLPMEEAGLVAFYGWSDGALCRLNQHPENYELLAAQTAEQRESVLEVVRLALGARDLDCAGADETGSPAPVN